MRLLTYLCLRVWSTELSFRYLNSEGQGQSLAQISHHHYLLTSAGPGPPPGQMTAGWPSPRRPRRPPPPRSCSPASPSPDPRAEPRPPRTPWPAARQRSRPCGRARHSPPPARPAPRCTETRTAPGIIKIRRWERWEMREIEINRGNTILLSTVDTSKHRIQLFHLLAIFGDERH